jgi:hypothetical protein
VASSHPLHPIDMEGFSYKRLGEPLEAQIPNVDRGPAGTMPVGEAIEPLKEWLKNDKQYSPQPYVQLASVLLRRGCLMRSRPALIGEARKRPRVWTLTRGRNEYNGPQWRWFK